MSNPYRFWEFQGNTYRSRRDSSGYIYISQLKAGEKEDLESMWYLVGNAGYDFCFRFRDVPKLAKRLGVPVKGKMDMEKSIAWYIWKPSSSDKYPGFTVQKERCRYSVHSDFGVGFHQCTRKGKIIIRKYAFCTQHAKMVNRGLFGKEVDSVSV